MPFSSRSNFFQACFSYSFIFALRFGLQPHCVSDKGYRRKAIYIQHRHTRLDERALLHAQEPVLEQVALRLHRPQAFAQVLAELDVDIAFRHNVLAQPLSRETLSKLFLLFLRATLALKLFSLTQGFEGAFPESLGGRYGREHALLCCTFSEKAFLQA